VSATQDEPHAERGRQESRKPRVAIVWYGVHDGGGAERAAAEYIRHFHDLLEIHVVAVELATDLRPLVRWHRIPAPRRPFILRFATFGLLASLRLARLDVDLVHALGAVVATRADLITVHFCHREYAAASGRLSPQGTHGLRRLSRTVTRLAGVCAERWCFRRNRVRLLAAVSRRQQKALEQLFPDCEVVLTPNGCDVARPPSNDDRARLRAEAGVGNDEVVILFIGNDWSRKRLDLAIASIATVPMPLRRRLRLWVVGDGDPNEVRALTTENRLPAEQVHVWGHQAYVAPYIAASDMFLLPSDYETFGIAAFEAASYGLPVIGTPINGIEELIGANESGALVRPDARSIAAALRELATHPDERARRGAHARSRALEYSWERAAHATLTQYRRLLDHERRTAD
jgi:glycosyltransferase involved in cell wall biosynthesis